MIRKFAKVPECRIALGLMLATILAGAATVHAQQTPEQTPPAAPAPAQQPAAQPPAEQSSSGQSSSGQAPSTQSSGQEASTEELGPRRKIKPKEYRNWNFNVGGGGSLTNGTTAKFARAGAIGAAGVARNYSKYFGLRVDFQWDNLPLRNSALDLAQAPGGTSQVYSFTFDPIINIPATKVWGGYLVFGPAFYRRSGKLDSSSAEPGSACNGFWNWWGTCRGGSLPITTQFLSIGQNEVGENFGGGITRRLTPKIELYGEFRYLHGTGGGRTTDLRPITVGVRW